MIIRITAWAGITLLSVVLLAMAASLWISRPQFDARLEPARLDSVVIAAPEQALTFARYHDGQQLRLLLVTQYQDATVTGVDVHRRFRTEETDPVALFTWLGYSALARAATGRAPEVSVPASSLALPYAAVEHNIGIGANYLEHARESQVEETPFVFPKRVLPTPATASVSKGDSRLLDYEAELGFVVLEDLAQGATPETMGLVLVNDFTDRWSLVLNLSRSQEMGTTGFVEGKSRAGYAPIGSLLVIPKDLATFYRQLVLKLYVNGGLRQQAGAADMLWGPDAMLQEIFRREQWSFRHYDAEVPLLPSAGVIRRGALILSGTPAGVIFKPLNLWNHWIYLQPGDEVILHSDGLGSLRNAITH